MAGAGNIGDSGGAASSAQALWYVAPGVAELRPVFLPSEPPSGHARVRMLWSGVSRGTERLVAQGRVPESERQRMRCPMQDGDFPFPVKYGYCAVARVETGPPGVAGRAVFVLHPHQSVFDAPVAMLTPLPEGLDPRRATLAANMETALNALWDSGAGPGDRIAVVGAGVVGLLVAYLAARLPGAEVHVIDPLEERRAIADRFGVRYSAGAETGDCDVVFHTSASAAGLSSAIELCGFEAKLVEMSWYGEGATPAPLGGAFHSRRLQLVSSQVGHVAASRRARWDYGRRLGKALDLLGDARLDALITSELDFAGLPRHLPAFLDGPPRGLAAAIRY